MRLVRILVTGGSGFVGLNVVEALLSAGIDVVSFDRRPMADPAVRAFRQLPGTLELVEGDIQDVRGVLAAARDTDAVIHGTAITPDDADEAALADLALAVNVGGTVNAVRAAAVTRLRRMVFLGSAAVYGSNATAPRMLDEDVTEPSPRSVYAISKYAAERLAERHARHEGICLRSLRLGSVFGPWEHATGVRATLSAIFQATATAVSSTATCVLPREGRRDWIYSRDAADAIVQVLAAEGAPSGPVNVGLGHEWTVADWCERLAGHFPQFRYRLAVAGEEPTIDFHGGTDRAPLAIGRLRREVGYEPNHGLDAAFADYMSWVGIHRHFLEGWGHDRH